MQTRETEVRALIATAGDQTRNHVRISCTFSHLWVTATGWAVEGAWLDKSVMIETGWAVEGSWLDKSVMIVSLVSARARTDDLRSKATQGSNVTPHRQHKTGYVTPEGFGRICHGRICYKVAHATPHKAAKVRLHAFGVRYCDLAMTGEGLGHRLGVNAYTPRFGLFWLLRSISFVAQRWC